MSRFAPTTSTGPCLRPMRFDGERRWALVLEAPVQGEGGESFVARAEAALLTAKRESAALVYGVVDASLAGELVARLGWTSLGPLPRLVRPLRVPEAPEVLALPRVVRGLLPRAPLMLPFGRRRRAGVRELTGPDPRLTRLWDRFSIDVDVAVERSAAYVNPRIWDRPDAAHRVFVFEDGDRYVIRALCTFRTREDRGEVVELLHDRSVAGMRAASHLLGLSLRELLDAGARTATAWSLVHSGSFPILARHAFVPSLRDRPHVIVRALDPAILPLVNERHRWYLSGLDVERG